MLQYTTIYSPCRLRKREAVTFVICNVTFIILPKQNIDKYCRTAGHLDYVTMWRAFFKSWSASTDSQATVATMRWNFSALRPARQAAASPSTSAVRLLGKCCSRFCRDENRWERVGLVFLMPVVIVVLVLTSFDHHRTEPSTHHNAIPLSLSISDLQQWAVSLPFRRATQST